jgi:hypothetical protein
VSDLHVMQVPRSGPSLRILVHASQEQVLQKPNVSRCRRIQPIVVLEPEEKELPLVAKSTSDIVPESLNPCVMDAPAIDESATMLK